MPINPDYDNRVSQTQTQTKKGVTLTPEQIQDYVQSYKKYSLFTVKAAGQQRENDEMFSAPTCSSDSIRIANGYVGIVNTDREGNKLFSNGANRQWCADFASYVINQAYHGLLIGFPSGVTSVSGIMDWGKKNNVYKTVPKMNKADFIKNNVKLGIW